MFMDKNKVKVHKHAEEETQYSATLTEQASLVNRGIIIIFLVEHSS